MLWEGVENACKIDGRMGGDLYIKIMEGDLQISLAFYDKTIKKSAKLGKRKQGKDTLTCPPEHNEKR